MINNADDAGLIHGNREEGTHSERRSRERKSGGLWVTYKAEDTVTSGSSDCFAFCLCRVLFLTMHAELNFMLVRIK